MKKPLRFRSKTTFNAHDSRSSHQDGGRHQIDNGVKRRCELVLFALLRIGDAGLDELTTHLQGRFSDSYSKGDVSTALQKLAKVGLITMLGKKRGAFYRPTREVLDKWRALDKQMI